MDESVRDVFVSYTPLKKIIDPSFEVMYEDELKFLSNHIMHTLNVLCDIDEFVSSRSGRRVGEKKVKNKLERMNTKLTKRLTSSICPLKRTH